MKTIIGYKLTDQKMQTHGGFQWEIGVEKSTNGEGDLCGPGWLHFYQSPLLAMLLNPIHANFSEPRLFKARVGGEIKEDRGLKAGATHMTLFEEMPLPIITLQQRVKFAKNCAAYAQRVARERFQQNAHQIFEALEACAQEAMK